MNMNMDIETILTLVAIAGIVLLFISLWMS
mgnify:CR=1 FL=1